MKVRFTFFLFLFLLVGCATIKPIPQEELNAIHKIGVVSILGDNLKIRFIGTTIFNNFDKDVSVIDWKIDKYVVDTLDEEITQSTSMSFQSVEYDIRPLLITYDKGNHSDQVKNELEALSKKNELDALIFVKREWFQDPIIHDQDVNGYGMFQRSFLSVKSSALHIVASATIYDTKQMTPLGGFYLIDDKEIDNSYFTKDFENLPNDKQKEIEVWMKDAIKKKLIEGLTKYGLLPPKEGKHG
jgi:hypothetical protein